ncbi:methyltransferase domain-containing protein [Candidatus Pelagibacter sp.]|nr:methyltransferase domain-containing protein [Candidatus Pelagibacter sp.]
MTPFLLTLIADPQTKTPLKLKNAVYDGGLIVSGSLVAENGNEYPIVNGIPLFVKNKDSASVESFGDEWNFFNFIDFKVQWLNHTVKNTFGSTDYFKDKIIVDAGGGSGCQTKWFLESGAKHVILLELSHSVNDVVKKNLAGFSNVDVVQCSIDQPPIFNASIEGIVYCHNVIQHTPSVEKTAAALWGTVAKGGELVFNCYPLNDQGLLRWIRFHLIYRNFRRVLSRMPFKLLLAYVNFVSMLRLIPLFGDLLEKLYIVVQGDVPRIEGENLSKRLKRRFKAAQLLTFDYYGSHSFQHHKSDFEILKLALSLQNNANKIHNLDEYFKRPQPIGCALRLSK